MSEIVPYQDIRVIFVSDYYDGPLSGVCRYKGATCSFNRDWSDDEDTFVSVQELSVSERLRKWGSRTIFGICVGWHWHYGLDGKRARYFGGRHPKWIWGALTNIYFKRPMFARPFFGWQW